MTPTSRWWISLVLLVFAGACAERGSDLDRARRALEAGEAEEAFQILVPALAENPETAEGQLLLARACHDTFRTSLAGRAAARAVELAPDDAEAHRIKARVNVRRYRIVPALAAAEQAAVLEPQNPRNHTLLGEVLMAEGLSSAADFGAAEAAFRESLRLAPDSPRTRFGLGKALVLGAKHTEGEAELDRFLEPGPEHGEAHYLRGLARLRRRDFEGAESDFRRAILLTPEVPPAYFNLSRVLRMTKQTEEAKAVQESYQSVQELAKYIDSLKLSYHTESADARVGMELAKQLARTSEIDDAIVLLETMCSDYDKVPRPHLLLAEAALDAKAFDRAAWAASRASELAPQNVAAIVLRAQVEMRRGRPDAAIPFAEEAVRMEPKEFGHRITLGTAFHDAGNYAEALRVFKEARSTDGRNVRATAGFGLAQLELGAAQEAEDALSTALARRPRKFEWFHARGRARVALGKQRFAEEDFRRALALAPHYAPAYESLAEVLRESGARGEAEEMQTRSRDLERNEKEIRDIREKLNGDLSRPDDIERLTTLLAQSGLENEAARLRSRALAAEWQQ